MYYKRFTYLYVLAFLLLPCMVSLSQTRINWQAWDANGAGHSLSGTVQVYSSLGQSLVGSSSTSTHLLHSGYLQLRVSSSGTASIVAQSSLDFGDVLVGEPAMKNLVVQNGGSAPLTISATSITPSVYSILSGGGPQSISAGGSITLRLQFRPASSGTATGTLTIENNSPADPTFAVSLEGRGILGPPDLQLSTLTLSFGSVPVLTPQDMELEVRNVGASNLEISQQIIAGQDSLHFSILQAATSSINPSGTSTMRIRHLPLSGGSKRAYLRLYSNDPDLPIAEVILTSIVTDLEQIPHRPSDARLYQNYPNPFNPTTEIQYSIPTDGEVLLRVYDLLGREVERLVEGFRPAGTSRIVFDGSDYPSGVYVYQIEWNGKTISRCMSLLK